MTKDVEAAFLVHQDLGARALEIERMRERHLARRRRQPVGPPPPLPVCTDPLPERGRTHLVIGDSHAHPDYKNWRYEWLGRMIVDLKPDVVVDMGDWWDMNSLLFFDRGVRGTRQLEGMRFALDCEAGIDAMERVRHQLDEYNRGVPKRRAYRPEMYRVLGNHEERIRRVIEWEPRFEGILSYDDLESREFGWTMAEPGEPLVVDGVSYVHYPFNTNSFFLPIYLCANAIRAPRSIVAARSSVFGHSHRRDYHETTGPQGRIQSLNAGCYFDYEHTWLPKSEQRRWWAGLVVLRNVRGGNFDHEWVSMHEVRRRYG